MHGSLVDIDGILKVGATGVSTCIEVKFVADNDENGIDGVIGTLFPRSFDHKKTHV